MSRSLFVLTIALSSALGCGAAQRSDPASAQPAPVATARVSIPDSAPTPAGHCVVRPRLASCPVPVEPGQHEALSRAIDTVWQRVLDAKFQDSDSLVEVARLQLLRDEPRGANGTSDAEEARRNGMRAVIVDPTPQAKLVLALAMTRLYQEKLGDSAAKRALFYDVVDRALSVDGTGPAVTAAQTLVGFHALASGKTDAAKRWLTRASAASALAEQGLAAIEGPIPLPEPALLSLPDELPSVEPAPLAACSGPLSTRREAAAFCAAIEQLRSAKTEAAKLGAARAVVGAFREVRPLCQAKDPDCGPNVIEALSSAAQAFGSADPKGIATARVALDAAQGKAQLRGVVPVLERQVANSYFAIGELAQAGRWYQRSVDDTPGEQSGDDVEFALAAGIVLSDGAMTRWVQRLTRDERFPAQRRSAWTNAIARSEQGDGSGEDCPPILHCAFIEILRDRTWSPGAR